MPCALSTGTKAKLQLGSAVGALALMAFTAPAFAADECGSGAGGTVTCAATGNPYAGGVVYTAVVPLTIDIDGDTEIATTGAITPGLNATAAAGESLTLNADAGSSITTTGAISDGVRLTTTTGDINATTDIVGTTGAISNGIVAGTTTGDLTLTATTTTTEGDISNGIVATTTTGALTVNTGNVTTTGPLSDAVTASSTSGNVLVNGGTISTQQGMGITASTGGAGTATVAGGAITTAGAFNTGVRVTTDTGAAVATPVSVTTAGVGADAIVVTSTGSTAEGGATTISTTGDLARGIVVDGATGATVGYGAITTTGLGSTGVVLTSGGTGDITGTGTALLSTTGTGADGIDATAAGDLTVEVGRVSATGSGSRGIVATSTAGTVDITSAGVVADGNGVEATNTGGAVSVALGGTNNSVTGSGVVVDASTTAGLTLAQGGTLNGAVNGATLTSGTTTTVNNSGTISGTVAAIDASGGGTVGITNNASGIINGRVVLGAGNDTVNNAGTFNAVGASDFGGGADVFTNTGTFNVRPGTATAGTVTLAGLEAFNNTGGLIDLRNDHTGDVLVLPGAYTGSGDARLAVDVNLSPAPTSADVLQIGGAAGGSTSVILNRLDSPAILSTAAGTTIVQAGAASGANAFVIAPSSQVDGVIQYGVVYDPAAFSYAVVSAPSAAAYRTALYGDGVRNLWLQSGDAWTAHMRELRDNIAANGPGGSGGRFWFQGFGQWERRRNASTFSFNGLTNTFDQGYDQDYYGFQLGMDLGAPVGDEGGFNFGVTAGYQNSNMSFPNTADRIRFNVVNGGLYASFTSGIFFINALGKYDYYWGEARSPAGLYAFDVNGSVWGAKAEAGLRFGTDFFIEPAVSLSWTNSDFDDFTVPSGNFAIDDEDGLRGKAGARVGWTTAWGGAKVSLYGGANYVREFRGRSNVVFTSGGQTVAFSNPRNRDYAEGILGVNVGSDSGKLSGFFEGRYADGRDYDGYGVRGGIRVRF